MTATTTKQTPLAPPTVLIVGAGLGGVMLGALLEKVSTPYTILKRASTVKPLGAALSIVGILLVLFERLQILDEFVSLAKSYTQSTVENEAGEMLSTTNYVPFQTLTGYRSYIIARPALYNLLLKQIPAHKIHFGKRVLTVSEDNDDEDKVHIQTADGATYQGDILIGADGAYSAVRQRLYEKLKAGGTLPKIDEEDLPFSCTCLVDQTEPLDLEEYPELKVPKV
ncbi:hypothetical protein BG015_008179 [Linnemannia schmuckeri]|uniref:FAD-binding domain-containing protein n=1 Tax=Linnemannia schmuckeri TaxID=64567 RepID=A0A9P5RXC3_9FUNG|nr:hypothetical protein BG015_008179 [Linnemannia schmuckeri]